VDSQAEPASQAELASAATAVRRGALRLARRLRVERPEAGLSAAKISVLGYLARNGTMTPGELATADRLQPQSLTRVLAELERSGHLRRERDGADRRQHRLSLTASGQEALVRDMRQRDSWLALAMAQELTSTECDLLRLAARLMERLAAAEEPRALRQAGSGAGARP
jgi:DNA-binding MarR family transcriptional regulator